MNIDHQVQLTILRELLFNPQAHFAQLNKTELTNDHFSFHLKLLLDKGLIEKVGEVYQLTPMGLEIAGRLDVKNLEFVKQPKVGVSICVREGDKVLLGKRLKDPNIGQCGFYAQKVRFGESLFETAKKCLQNETGLEAEFKYAGEIHIIRKEKGIILVDVIFTCFKTVKIWGDLKEKTKESENFWVKYTDAYNLPNIFPDLKKDLDLYKKDELFFEEMIEEN
jgi:8-oxo-dGTP diphosphatase